MKMFIIKTIKKVDADDELKKLYAFIEKNLGFLPPHFELFATLDAEALKEFLKKNLYFTKHKKVDAEIFPYLRLYIAKREGREYCIKLNTKLILSKGMDVDTLDFDFKQKLLLKKVLKAIYEAKEFSKDDMKELYSVGFCDKDFFEVLDYATSFMAKSKMIEIFSTI
jgi:hypothetical protein